VRCIDAGGYGGSSYGGYSDGWGQGGGQWGGPAPSAGSWNQGGGYGSEGYGESYLLYQY